MDISIGTVASVVTFLISIVSIGITLGKILQQLKDLSEKVDKHNQVIERTYRIEENIGSLDLGVMAEKIHANEKAIDELKKSQKGCNPLCQTNTSPRP